MDRDAVLPREPADGRERGRRLGLSILLAPLAGLLPGDVQKSMANEFGAPALPERLPIACHGRQVYPRTPTWGTRRPTYVVG